MKGIDNMLIVAVLLIVPGIYCLYIMDTGNAIAALGGGLTTNGLIAFYFSFRLWMLNRKMISDGEEC